MGQKKLVRFNEIKTFDNVLEFPQEMQGKWHTFFKNDNPITLELACGKGEYAVGLGRMYPERNFIGIDIKGNRIQDLQVKLFRYSLDMKKTTSYN